MTINRIIWTAILLTFTCGIYAQSKESDKYFAKGMSAFQKGDYRGAIEAFSHADELDVKELPKGSSRLGYSKSWIAYCYHILGDDKRAREISKYDYLELPVDRRLTKESDKEADSVRDNFHTGNYEDALSHALKCLEIEDKTLGKGSIHCIGSCLTIADIYRQMQNYAEAIKWCDEGLERLSNGEHENNPYSFDLLCGRVYNNLAQDLPALAYPDLLKLKRISEDEEAKNGNKIPSAIVKSLESRIKIQSREDFAQAVNLSTEAFYLLLDSYTPEDEEVFPLISECLTQLEMLNQWDLIVELIHKMLDESEKINMKTEHRGLLLSWAGDCFSDSKTALQYHEQAAPLLWECQVLDHYFSNQCMIANDYIALNRIPEAIDVLNKVCEHYETGDQSQGTYRRALLDLGDLFLDMGRIEEAGKRYEKILSLLESSKSSPDYILTFFKWMTICAKSWNQTDKSEQFSNGYEIGRELRNVLNSVKIHNFIDYGIGIPVIAKAIFPFYQVLLSNATLASGIPWAAIENDLRGFIYEELIPVCTLKDPLACKALSLLGHINYLLGNNTEAISLSNQAVEISIEAGWEHANYLHDLAYYQYDSGDVLNAYPNFRIGYDFQKNDIINHFRWMTLDERTAYSNSKRGNLDNLPHYAAITPNDSRYAELGYDALLFTKGLLLNSTIELSRLLHEEGDEEALSLFSKWSEANHQLNMAISSKAPNVKENQNAVRDLERALIEKSKVFGDYTKGLEISFKDVQSKLKDNDIAVEIFSYWKDGYTKHYGALVLNKQNNPFYVSIGDDKQWRDYDLTGGCYDSSSLFNTMFSELKEYMPTRERGDVFFAPDGLFHTLAIENLPGAEFYNLKRLSSTRELTLSSDASHQVKSMGLFGGISYGLGEAASFYTVSNEGDRASDDFLIDLPGTKKEIETINTLFQDKIKVDKNTEDKGSKSRFMGYSNHCPDVLHIATHGFFNRESHNSMSSTGLYFAGAQNTIWNMDTEALSDNGILTSEEISCLDLRGLNLAVLSACETGLGHINQEGVFGLQRGFKQAGAKAIMMSLWRVQDEATNLLMTEFYNNLSNSMKPYEALREAQTVVKSAFPNPKSWAGFVLIDANNNLKI